MRVSYLLLLLTLTTTCVVSCDQDGSSADKEAVAFLEQSKKEINGYLDSANYYCDELILQYKAGTKKEMLVIDYAPRIKYYENSVNTAFDKAYLLSKVKQLPPGTYERWLGSFNLKQLAEKNKKLTEIGIDLKYVPAGNFGAVAPKSNLGTNVQLEQLYESPASKVSINLPKDWQVTEKKQETVTTILAAGPASDNNAMTRKGAVEINIIEFDKDFTSEDFYNGNIASVKTRSKDFKMMQETELDLSGIPSKCAIFSCNNNGVSITSIQVYFFMNRKGYIINGMSGSDHFSDYKDLYLSIIKTFRLKP